jgi:hypothetical protein
MQNVRINKAYGHLKMKRLVKKEEKTTHIETHDFFFRQRDMYFIKRKYKVQRDTVVIGGDDAVKGRDKSKYNRRLNLLACQGPCPSEPACGPFGPSPCKDLACEPK